MSTKLVQLSMSGSVAVVTLDDPDRRNVLSREMVAGIETAFDEAEADDRVRAVVVAGTGRAFSAGAELDTLLSAVDGDFAPVEAVYAGFLRVLRSPLLTIGAIGGPAVGAGLVEEEDAAALATAWRMVSRLRNAITLVRGRPAEQLPRDARERAAVASILGYPPGETDRMVNDYLRTTRLAKGVVDRVFWTE